MVKTKLTAKQEAFCLAYLETGNASEGYRQAYKTDRMKPLTINKRASELLARGDIAGRLDELREPVRARAQLTLESHLQRLKDLSEAAERKGQFAAAIAAETNRGKAAGLYVEKVDHSNTDGSLRKQPTRILLVAPQPNE